MRYHALACDYDGTLAEEGCLGVRTEEALDRLRRSGRKLVLVTGRILEDLETVLPRLDLFDRIVAENGAVLHRPATRETLPLAPASDAAFVAALQREGVTPLAVGHCIVASWEPHQDRILETIRALGLELQVIFNKGAVMVLPTSVNKASGLAVALRELGLSPRNCVGVGDAENDHAFLRLCECGVAVANALPLVMARADWVTPSPRGAGVVELVARMLEDDLESLPLRDGRDRAIVGHDVVGRPLTVPAHDTSVLVAGTSGSGKTTFCTGLIERFTDLGGQVCIVDPEGDYADFGDFTTLGSSDQPPNLDEVMQLLERPGHNVSVNLLDVELSERPALFARLFTRIQELRSRTGRPHWLLVDEAHHLLPLEAAGVDELVPREVAGVVWVTVEPQHLAPHVIRTLDHVVAIGKTPDETLSAVAGALGAAPPSEMPAAALPRGDAVFWDLTVHGEPARLFRTIPPRSARRRHMRKYAEGTLGEDLSFYFRGPEARLRLRASNLVTFLELAEGVDDETWTHHLETGDVSRWFGSSIKNPDLAREASAIEQDAGSPAESRTRIREAVLRHYTLPA